MLIALIIYNIFHPGRLMPGKESNLPSRKVRKSWKKAGIAPQGRVGQDYLLPKYKSTSRAPSPSEDLHESTRARENAWVSSTTGNGIGAFSQEQGLLYSSVEGSSSPGQAFPYGTAR